MFYGGLAKWVLRKSLPCCSLKSPGCHCKNSEYINECFTGCFRSKKMRFEHPNNAKYVNDYSGNYR